MNGQSRLTYFLRRSAMDNTGLKPLCDFILDFWCEGWGCFFSFYYYLCIFFMYLHFSPFNPFTLRPRYDVMRFFVALTLEFLDEFLWLNISHETSLTGLFFSSISAFFSPLATGSVRGERAGLS